MPILKDFRHFKEITLPSFEDSKVVIYHSLLAKDVDLAIDLQNGKVSQILLVLPKLIKEWNFTDEAGVVLPITPENVNLIPQDDLIYIIEQVKEFAEDIKKK